jgi:transcriptional antiterminator NusG
VSDELNHSTDEPRSDATGAVPSGVHTDESHEHAAEPASVDGPIEPTADAHDAASDPEHAEPIPGEQSAAEDHVAAEHAAAEHAATHAESDASEPPSRGPIELTPQPDRPEPTGKRDWYILKVQSNREDSIREALQRKIAMAGLQDFFGECIVPIEMVSEFKNGKKRIVKRKLYPGYLVVNMELNEDTWFLVRETHGIGDFTGSGGKPSPMLPHEVARILSKQEEKTDEAPKLNIKFRPGDRVKITEGTFENFEGDVDAIDEANGRVTVMINIFGRSTPVELEYWQVESL